MIREFLFEKQSLMEQDSLKYKGEFVIDKPLNENYTQNSTQFIVFEWFYHLLRSTMHH